MRLFTVTAYYSFRALFHWLQPMPYLINRALFPLTQLAFFALIGTYGGGQPLSFYLVGNAIGTATLTAFGVSQAVADERQQGTLSYLLAAPAPRIPVFFGRAALHVADGMVNMVAALAIAVILFGLRVPVEGIVGVICAMLVATVAIGGLGLLIGAVAYIVLDTAVLANFAMFIILLLSGANVPLAELPGVVGAIAQGIPLTRSVAAARLFVGGGSFEAGVGLLLGDLALGALYGIAGFFVFNWLETRARHEGRLEGV
jgi:ABC-2 type transport system permease protein